MKALIKNRNNYEFIDIIVTRARTKTSALVDILSFAQSRFGFSQNYQIITDKGIIFIYDDKFEIIFPIK